MKPIVSKHFHTLKRIGKRATSFYQNRYRCTGPECNYVQRAELLEGKRVLCPLCMNPDGYIIQRDQLFNTIPRCPACSKSKKAMATAAVADELENLLSGIVSPEDRED